MSLPFIHEISASFGVVAVGNKHVVRQHHSSPGLTVIFQCTVNHLQEIKLLVGAGCSVNSFVSIHCPFFFELIHNGLDAFSQSFHQVVDLASCQN